MRQAYQWELDAMKPKTVRQQLMGQVHAGLIPHHIMIADKRGKVIGQYPERRFVGLDTLINTGYSNEPPKVVDGEIVE